MPNVEKALRLMVAEIPWSSDRARHAVLNALDDERDDSSEVGPEYDPREPVMPFKGGASHRDGQLTSDRGAVDRAALAQLRAELASVKQQVRTALAERDKYYDTAEQLRAERDLARDEIAWLRSTWTAPDVPNKLAAESDSGPWDADPSEVDANPPEHRSEDEHN